MPDHYPEEVLVKDLKTKEVFHYIDKENGFDRVSREVYKDGSKVVHFPYNRRTGLPRYERISKITYQKMPDPLPHGFNKSWTTGYGFTRTLNPLIYFVQDNFPAVREIVVSSVLETKLEKRKLTINAGDADAAYKLLDPLLFQHRREIKHSAAHILSTWFPKQIESVAQQYSPGHLDRIIRQHSISATELSVQDRQSILDLISQFSEEDLETKRKQLVSAKSKIDKVYIETVLADFDELIDLKTDSKRLEEKWHEFLKENSWIFSQLFAYPMVLFKDKAFVGGKSVLDSGGKIADFLYKNEFSMNLAIIEIKTHLTKLMSSTPYRGLYVFSITKYLSRAINQVLDQRDNLQKEFYSLSKGSEFNTFNSKCVVLVGRVSDLSSDQLKSFELFRSEVKDVDIVTFDELLEKLKALLELFES